MVNYPNDYDYTRVTEFKHLTGQLHPKTGVVYEFPRSEGDPYYPIPKPECTALYNRYKELADVTPGVHFVGRLATYKYYNMDQVVAQALATYDKILGARKERIVVPAQTVIPAANKPIAPRVAVAAVASANGSAASSAARSSASAVLTEDADD